MTDLIQAIQAYMQKFDKFNSAKIRVDFAGDRVMLVFTARTADSSLDLPLIQAGYLPLEDALDVLARQIWYCVK